MKNLSLVLSCLFAVTVLVGCASTSVISRLAYGEEKIARLSHIIIYDFAATPGDMPAWAAADQYASASTNQTVERIAEILQAKFKEQVRI